MFKIKIAGMDMPHVDQEKEALNDIADVRFKNCENKAELLEFVKDAHAIMTDTEIIDADVIESAPDLKVIVEYGIGVNNIDIEAASKNNVMVCNVPDVFVQEVAEHALALMFSVARNINNFSFDTMSQNKWDFNSYPAIKLSGKTLGLIGFGNIGSSLARMAFSMGMKIVVFDPYIKRDAIEGKGYCACDLDYLIKNSDVISIHAPYTKTTHHLIGKDQIKEMKSNSIIINVSRGGIIDEHALAEALNSGKLFGAGIDVLEDEPQIKGNPLLDCPNVIITPHAAWKSETAAYALEMAAVKEVRSVLLNNCPINLVNKNVGQKA